MNDMIERITQAYEKDQLRLDQPTRIGELPLSYESLNNEWLTNVLCGKYPGAEVINHKLDAKDNGSSNRRRVFLEYNDAGSAADLPASLFCKASHDLENRLVLGISGGAHCEAVFYNDIRPHLDIEGPSCFFAEVEPQ